MAVVTRPYQICEACWRARAGGGGRQPVRLRGDVREATPCALCGTTTESGHYRRLADDEVRTKVTVVYQDGPRRGDIGTRVLMSVRQLDTTDSEGTPIRYACELVGDVLYAKVAPWQREDDQRVEGLILS